VSSKKRLNKSTSTLVTVLISVLMLVSANSYAIEPLIHIHKADQEGTYGVSLGLSDSFFKQKEFNWSVSYNRLQDVNVTWNGDDIDFSLDTIDLMLSYRYQPKSYSTFIKSLMFEFQAGVGVSLTENKFVWPALNEEKFFSEQGDINGVVAFLVHKKFTNQVSMQLGVKHYPDYSEFGNVSSIFVGFSYRFGQQEGY